MLFRSLQVKLSWYTSYSVYIYINVCTYPGSIASNNPDHTRKDPLAISSYLDLIIDPDNPETSPWDDPSRPEIDIGFSLDSLEMKFKKSKEVLTEKIKLKKRKKSLQVDEQALLGGNTNHL